MTCPWPDPRRRRIALDRRSLLALLAASIGAAAAPWRQGSPLKVRTEDAPTVFFHLDRLHLDRGGLSVPYRAPTGARSLAQLARMSEAQIRSAHPYL
jgi:hypothetical protein